MKVIKTNCILFAILLVTALIYSPILGNDFLYFWDDQWVVINDYTTGGWSSDNLWHIFTDFYNGQYAPFTELSFLILYSISGYNPFFFHLASLLWHIGCICLVWKFISSLLELHGKKSRQDILFITSITTLLFAVHPVNVESIAWSSAVKALIYGFFYLSGLLFYIRYIQTFRLKYYLIVIFCFFSSFLGKEQAVTFPLLLLVIDWYTNRDMKNLDIWNEKLLFFILSLFFGLITILSQGGGNAATTYPLTQRLALACYTLFEYFMKCIFPVQLNYLYPFPMLPGETLPNKLFVYPVILLCLFSWIMAYRKNEDLLLGVLLFVINLLVALHLIPISRHAIVADRYLYLSYIGVAFLIACGIFMLKKREKYFRGILIVFVVYVIYLSAYTWQYSQKWRNTSEVKRYLREIVDERVKEEKRAKRANQINKF